MLKLGGGVRTLGERDLPGLLDFLGTDPIGGCAVSARVESHGVARDQIGVELWGFGAPLVAVCHAGGNLVPVGDDPQALRGFADRARRTGRRCSSIVGRIESVAPLWAHLADHWGPPRVVRAPQPLLATSAPARIPADPGVRQVRVCDLDTLLPACVAMFTEEVGVSPLGSDRGAAYRQRVGDLVRAGRAYARIEGGRVIFKAEVGAVSHRACQVQGVWVRPELRGRGYGAAGMASVVNATLRDAAPVVSLYVNDFNVAARRVYERVGFQPAGAFMSVMF